MARNIHMCLTNEVNDGLHYWLVYFCCVRSSDKSARTFGIAVRSDTTFEELCAVVTANYSVENVLVQDAMFVRTLGGGIIGMAKIVGNQFIPWKQP